MHRQPVAIPPWLLAVALALCSLAWLAAPARAADPGAPLAVPALSGRVVDAAGALPPADRAALEAQLQAFEQRKGSQVAVLVIATSGPETIEQFGIRVAEQWKLGRRKVDDGAILLIATADHSLRIEVGYGLEGVLNDATCKRIIDETMVPRLRQGDLPGAIHAGVDQMLKVVDGEPLPPPAAAPAPGLPLRHLLPLGLVVAIVAGGVLRALFGPLPAALMGGGVIGAVMWLVTGIWAISVIASVIGFVFILLNGASGRGMWFGGPGGGGFGGGGSGGGFSGGGGGFGGGGASGRW